MNEPVQFTVYGIPQPQAGTKSVPAGRTQTGRQVFRKITEGGKDLKPWRAEVSTAAKAELDKTGEPFHGPVRLEVEFRFPMPKSRPQWARLQRFLLHTTKPDLDKLVRAIGDSLTVAGLFGDDASVAQIKAAKVEVHDGWTGAVIRVVALDPRAFPHWGQW